MKTGRRGFTLLEVMMVVLVLAIIAAAATLRVRGQMNRAEMKDVVGAVRAFDSITRASSREQDRTLYMMVSPLSGTIARVDQTGFQTKGSALKLAEGFAIAEVRIAGKGATAGDTMIACSRMGLTPSYAVKVTGKSGEARWVFFAGLSGESTEIDDESEVRAVLATTRNDAD